MKDSELSYIMGVTTSVSFEDKDHVGFTVLRLVSGDLFDDLISLFLSV